LGTQVQKQTFVPGYLSDKATTTGARNILYNRLQKLGKNCIRNTRTSKSYRKYPRTGGTKPIRFLGTRRYLGNNNSRTQKKNIKKNNIFIIYSKHNYPCVTRYSPYTRRHSPNKHTI
jgi:hypothetical protein